MDEPLVKNGTVIKVENFKADIRTNRNKEGVRRPNFNWISLCRFTTVGKFCWT